MCVWLYSMSEPVKSDTPRDNISLVPWCVRLDRFWHPVQSHKHFPAPLVCQVRQVLTSSDLSNLTHQGTREMFVWLYRMSEPVKSDTPRDQGNVCVIVLDVRTCLIWHTISLVPWCVRLDRFWHPVQSHKHFPGPLVCQIWQVLTYCTITHTFHCSKCLCDCTGCQNLSNLTHQGTREMFVWLYWMSEPV
jgi:hypothetical protein